MMLNFIDALGTFENPVGQLVAIGGIAALDAVLRRRPRPLPGGADVPGRKT